MTVERGQEPVDVGRRAGELSRRSLIAGAAVGVAGLAGAGALAAGDGRGAFASALAGASADDPAAALAGMPAAGMPTAGLPMADAPRRGRKGFRPRRPLADGTVFGRITIPTLGLDDTLREGVDLRFLDFGPGHWPGTAFPGQRGNCVIAGHRVSHSRPFRFIDTIPAGATMTLTMAGVDHDYVATGSSIVDPTDNAILAFTNERQATILACHPPGQTTLRFLVNFAAV